MDSNALNWRIRYDGRTGFVAKFFSGKPTLMPCGQKPSALVSSPTDSLGGGVARVDTSRSVAVPLPQMLPIRGGTFTMGRPPDEVSSALIRVPRRSRRKNRITDP